MKFVGHKLSTTVVKCSPKLFRPSPALLDAIKVRKRAPGYTVRERSLQCSAVQLTRQHTSV